jgi:hypothetical protein
MRFPGKPSILSGEDGPATANGKSIPIVSKRHGGQCFDGSSLLDLPVLASVFGVENQTVLSHNPTASSVAQVNSH